MLRILRRIQTGPGVIILVAAFLICSGAIWLWVHSVIQRRWDAAVTRVSALEQSFSNRPDSRTVLWGANLSGRAWEEYSSALATPGYQDLGLANRLVSDSPHFPLLEHQAIKELIAAKQEELDHFRKGAHCSALGPLPSELVQRWDGNLAPAFLVPRLAVWEARFQLEGDRPREAAEMALEACQFARDIGHLPIPKAASLSARCFRDAFGALREIVASKKTDAEVGALIESALTLLDSGFPTDEDRVKAVALWDGRSWLKQEPQVVDQSISGMRLMTLWDKRRFLFSSRAVVAGAIEFETDWVDSFKGVDDLPVGEANKVYQAYWDAAKDSRNPILVDNVAPHLNHFLRFPRAQLQLLRAASHFKATGEVQDFRDPFGTVLLHEVRDHRLVIWSVGMNGKDDRGTGEFDCTWMNQGSKDIVLELEH